MVAVSVLLLAGCASSNATERRPDASEPAGSPGSNATPATPEATAPPAGRQRDLVYWEGDGGPLRLDACLPERDGDDAVPAVVLIHGGGFVSGGKSALGGLCDELAVEGYAAFTIDYRLAPAFVFPSQVDDVRAAVDWLREPEQVAQFGIDPARVGLVGSSAGAILAQWVGTAGEGDRTTGGRVAAVASLSGPSVFTEQALTLGTPTRDGAAMVLAYLNCTPTTPDACPQAAAASPITAIDATDPPFLLVNSTAEIVPIEQARAMRDALTAAGVPVQLVEVPGARHGVDVLQVDGRPQLLAFLAETLG
ncbi:alpha/beta hydrolase [Agromyces intestinalis]|nr:alpha/beta hydrolase [Agromyces intestinalis]